MSTGAASPADLTSAPASTATNDQFVYRLLTRSEWSSALSKQRYLPTALDQRDGFIHLSTLQQSLATARLHFARATELLLCQLNAAALWPHLRWEAVEARGGALFPHYYQPYIALAHVTQLTEMDADGAGQHALNPYLVNAALLTPQRSLASPLPPLYKIVHTSAYAAAQQSDDGQYGGNAKDTADGFIHLSTLEQVHWVLQKFSGSDDALDPLLLLTLHLHGAVDGYRLLWEAARSLRAQPGLGFVNLFCHVYGAAHERPPSIDVRRSVVRVDRLRRAADGTLLLPHDLRSTAAATA